MASDEHLKLIKRGLDAWNTWREENPVEQPDLSGADLREADLNGANLVGTNLVAANAEIRRAKKVEREENRRKLFPIRLVDFETIEQWECFDADSGKDLAVEVREYYIPDFSNWKDHDAFGAEFGKLLRALKAEEG